MCSRFPQEMKKQWSKHGSHEAPPAPMVIFPGLALLYPGPRQLHIPAFRGVSKQLLNGLSIIIKLLKWCVTLQRMCPPKLSNPTHCLPDPREPDTMGSFRRTLSKSNLSTYNLLPRSTPVSRFQGTIRLDWPALLQSLWYNYVTGNA